MALSIGAPEEQLAAHHQGPADRRHRLLEQNPGLQPKLPDVFEHAYIKARILATNETGLDEAQFPGRCPWPPEQVLDDAFWLKG